MILRLVVPALGDLREMKLLAWRKAPGDPLALGEPLAELETDKAVIEVSAGRDAFLRRVEVAGGDWYALGTTLALLSTSPDEPLDQTGEAGAVLVAATCEAL